MPRIIINNNDENNNLLQNTMPFDALEQGDLLTKRQDKLLKEHKEIKLTNIDPKVKVQEQQQLEVPEYENTQLRLAQLELRVLSLEQKLVDGQDKFKESFSQIESLKESIYSEQEYRYLLQQEVIVLRSLIGSSENSNDTMKESNDTHDDVRENIDDDDNQGIDEVDETTDIFQGIYHIEKHDKVVGENQAEMLSINEPQDDVLEEKEIKIEVLDQKKQEEKEQQPEDAIAIQQKKPKHVNKVKRKSLKSSGGNSIIVSYNRATRPMQRNLKVKAKVKAPLSPSSFYPSVFELGPSHHSSMLHQLKFVKTVMDEIPWAKLRLRDMLTKYTQKELTKDEMFPQLCHLTKHVEAYVQEKKERREDQLKKKTKLTYELTIAQDVINSSTVIKYGRHGKPHQTQLLFDPSNPTALHWKSKNGLKSTESLQLHLVDKIELGYKTPVFLRASKKSKLNEDTCISLTTTERTLDLSAKDSIQRDWLLRSFNQVVAFAKEWHKLESKRRRLRRM